MDDGLWLIDERNIEGGSNLPGKDSGPKGETKKDRFRMKSECGERV